MKKSFSMLDTAAACDAGFELEITDPFDGTPTGMFVTVLGKDSKVFRDHVRRSANDRLKRQQMAQKRGKDVDVTVEQIEDEAVELLTACTTAWRADPARFEGLPAFSPEEVRKFYARSPEIRGQIDEAMGDMGNFSPPSSKASKPSLVASSS